MRLLMVGPVQLVAMRRHVQWAMESGIEVCVANLGLPDAALLPTRFPMVDLLPQRATTIHQLAIHKNSRRAQQIALLRLRRLWATFQPQIVHSYKLGRATELCLQAGVAPLVVSVWGYLNKLLAMEAAPEERRWLRRLRAGARVVLVENPNLMEALLTRSDGPMEVECFPIGVDGSLFHPNHHEKAAAWRFVLDIPPEAVVVLSPRGWSPVYGQHHIMQAFAQAYQRLGRSLVLVFLGMGRSKKPQALAREVLNLGASQGVGHAIRWIPEVPYEDMPGVYALADLVVNYPRSDAFPSTLLEAAACARPVVTSDLPAYRNTFVERFCRLVQPENAQALAEALVEELASNPAAGLTRAQEARQAVLDQYDEQSQKERLISLYHRIAREHQ